MGVARLRDDKMKDLSKNVRKIPCTTAKSAGFHGKTETVAIMNLKDKLKVIRISCEAIGIWETLKATLAYLLKYKPRNDRWFDRKFSTDTSSPISHEDLDISDAEAKKSATYYISSPVRFVRYIIDKLEIDYREYDFVDIGCGKGRILMIASDYPFRSISGIELSQALCMTAKKNLQIYRSPKQKCHNVQVHHMNATELPKSIENTVFYLYHPFEVQILTSVLNNVKSAFHNTDKMVWIIYIWSQVTSLSSLFEEFGFKRFRYEWTMNPRWQYTIFTLGQE